MIRRVLLDHAPQRADPRPLRPNRGFRPTSQRAACARTASSGFLRQTFVERVASSVPHSFWARAFYDSHRAKGASHNATIRALAFKWIRILFRCWIDRTPYNESRYLAALQKRHSPLLKFAAQTPS